MKPTMEILERIKKNSEENKDEVFTRIYRYLLRPDIYFVAYQNLYSNNGASTKGVDDDTADGFSEAKIERIIKCLEDERHMDFALIEAATRHFRACNTNSEVQDGL